MSDDKKFFIEIDRTKLTTSLKHDDPIYLYMAYKPTILAMLNSHTDTNLKAYAQSLILNNWIIDPLKANPNSKFSWKKHDDVINLSLNAIENWFKERNQIVSDLQHQHKIELQTQYKLDEDKRIKLSKTLPSMSIDIIVPITSNSDLPPGPNPLNDGLSGLKRNFNNMLDTDQKNDVQSMIPGGMVNPNVINKYSRPNPLYNYGLTQEQV